MLHKKNPQKYHKPPACGIRAQKSSGRRSKLNFSSRYEQSLTQCRQAAERHSATAPKVSQRFAGFFTSMISPYNLVLAEGGMDTRRSHRSDARGLLQRCFLKAGLKGHQKVHLRKLTLPRVHCRARRVNQPPVH